MIVFHARHVRGVAVLVEGGVRHRMVYGHYGVHTESLTTRPSARTVRRFSGGMGHDDLGRPLELTI